MPPLDPAQLRPRTLATTRRALASGALQPIATELRELDDDGTPFQVRILGDVAYKEGARRHGQDDPFADPESALVVGDLSDTHVAVLNKFNVVDQHLLIVTREYEDQLVSLTQADFDALWVCMAGVDGLGFYNAGHAAGASQSHKHLQLVPPLGPDQRRAPLESLVGRALPDRGCGTVTQLGAVNAVCRLHLHEDTPRVDAARALAEAYASLRDNLGFGSEPPPYNLLVTRDWMMLVPRSRAEYEDINVNALGFAGSLLVRSADQLAVVERRGPFAILAAVGVPPGE